MKPEVHIENWTIFNGKIVGEVQDHPRFEEGTKVTTSRILTKPVGRFVEGNHIETKNTVYILGKEA